MFTRKKARQKKLLRCLLIYLNFNFFCDFHFNRNPGGWQKYHGSKGGSIPFTSAMKCTSTMGYGQSVWPSSMLCFHMGNRRIR